MDDKHAASINNKLGNIRMDISQIAHALQRIAKALEAQQGKEPPVPKP